MLAATLITRRFNEWGELKVEWQSSSYPSSVALNLNGYSFHLFVLSDGCRKAACGYDI